MRTTSTSEILIIGQDLYSSQRLANLLKSHKFSSDIAEDVHDGVEIAKVYQYDLIMLQGHEDLVPKLRYCNVETPIIVLQCSDPVDALNNGADDALPPCHADEVIARVRSVLRRACGHASNVIQVGAMEVDVDKKEVRVAGEPVKVTPTEFKLLEMMAMRTGQPIQNETIMSRLYSNKDEAAPKIINVFVCKLRSKLREYGADHYVRTEHGIGYKLTA